MDMYISTYNWEKIDLDDISIKMSERTSTLVVEDESDT